MSCRRLLAFMLSLLALGCQRAGRYPSGVVAKPVIRDAALAPAKAIWSWHHPEGWREPADVPIVFVAHGQKEWDNLGAFWNHFPPPAAGTRSIHLGHSPFGIAAAMVLADRMEVVKIKAPLGLSDPTANLPGANPPSLGKWKLGRRIFFDRRLVVGSDRLACASCHRLDHGFAEDRHVTLGGTRNTPSLINVAFNRHQFWDGRAAALEEVVVRSLDDETVSRGKQSAAPQETHRFGGMVRELASDADYSLQFKLVFDLQQPTQDAIAKALATYLRTIVSGNSLYDRAERHRLTLGAPELRAEHFAPLLDGAMLQALQAGAKDETAKQLEQGHRLFHSKGCVTCHPPPLFTDHDFHNIGIGESERHREPGTEIGRFAHVPIGLKEPRLVGAFKTPTLRGLPRTAPYFHDGTAPTLRSVVAYYNHPIVGYRSYLARPLVADAQGTPRSLDLTEEDQAALVLFLRALDGESVDSTVAAAPK